MSAFEREVDEVRCRVDSDGVCVRRELALTEFDELPAALDRHGYDARLGGDVQPLLRRVER